MLEFEVIPAALLLILSMLSPFIIATVTRAKWSSKTRELIAAGVAIVVAIGWLALTGAISDWSNLAVAIPAVYTLQSLLYRFFLKEWATKFEAVTTPGSVTITPAENAGNVEVTSSESIKLSEQKKIADPHVEANTPLEVERTNEVPEPKG